MKIADNFGLRVAHVDVEGALRHRWLDYRSAVDVVRVSRPEPASWTRLQAAGFAVKPAWLTWLMPTPADPSDFLGQLPQDVRRSFRRGLRYCESAPVDFELHARPDAATVDQFLVLYEEVISGMDRGVLFATDNRRMLFEQLDSTVVMLAFRGGQLIGGALWQTQSPPSTLYIRFNVVEQQERRHYLTWAMLLRAFEFARSAGFTTLTFGSDPNLYGHIARTGLFCFKHRLGFRAVPAQLLATGHDEADLVLGLDGLADPSFMVCYDLDRPPELVTLPYRQISCPALRGDLISHRPVTELKMFQAGFLTKLRLHPVEELPMRLHGRV